jgi:hypothetical protein
VVHISTTRTEELNSPPVEPHVGERHTYDGVLRGAPKGSFVTLPSARCLTPLLRWTRALFAVLRRHFPPRRRRLALDFGWDAFGKYKRMVIIT